ncbi:MAG: universal stress protein [Mucilaginibacter sp.]
MKKILIAIDDSKTSEHAAVYGFDLARLYNAEVCLVHIVEPMTLPSSGTDMISGNPFEGAMAGDLEIIKAQTDSSDNILQKTEMKFGADLKVTHFTEYGSPATGIVDRSKEFKADLIVLGTHGRTGLDRLLMGSVAEHVVRHSEVPVLVVPFKE